MLDELQQLEKDALAELAALKNEEQVLAVRTKYLGRKGLLTGLLRNISQVPDAEKPLFGKRCNELKESLNSQIEDALKVQSTRKKEDLLLQEKIDVTLPGRTIKHGRIHPVIQIRREICAIFASFGFSVVEGPEIELDYYNFEALNIPQDHPARDMQDTFYIEENIVLRTHTSPVQIRTMEKMKPPVRIL
jgi:phenylalanyl-tRNA synthetase alpha chain